MRMSSQRRVAIYFRGGGPEAVGDSIGDSAASAVNRESREMINSFEFPILVSSPTTVVERLGVTGWGFSAVYLSKTTVNLAPKATFIASSVSLWVQGREFRRCDGPIVDVASGGLAALATCTSPEMEASIGRASVRLGAVREFDGNPVT